MRLLVVTFAAALCTRVAVGQPQPNVSDSARIRIVDYAAIGRAPVGLRIEPTPRMHFGGLHADSTLEFDGTSTLSFARFSTGTVVIADKTSLKVFDIAGKLIQVVGRRGLGPGEFTTLISQVCVIRGDTILVFENGPSKLHAFSPTLQHLRTRTIPPGTVFANPCLANGTFLKLTLPVPNPNSALPPERAPSEDAVRWVRWMNSQGQALDSLGPYSATNPAQGVAATLSAVAHDSTVVVGDGRAAEFRMLNGAGRTITIVRWRDPRIPVSSVATLPARSAASAPRRAIVPAYSGILVDGGGRIWIRSHPMGMHPGEYLVFARDGALVGWVVMPSISGADGPPGVVAFAGEDAVLFWRGADGSRHLTTHAVVRPNQD